MKIYYGVKCLMGCGKNLAITSSETLVDVELPDSAIVCPVDKDGCVYAQDRLINFDHLDLVAEGFSVVP